MQTQPTATARGQNHLVEDLQRLRFKLQLEAALAQDPDLNRRLADLAMEAEDALMGLGSVPQDSLVSP